MDSANTCREASVRSSINYLPDLGDSFTSAAINFRK